MIKTIKILYVDDEPTNLLLFKINFSKKYEVFTANGGPEGLRILADHPDDIKIIISDMNMPLMNGIQFIQKAKEAYPDKNYFILTAYDENDEINNAIDTGLIHGFFKKPINIKEIDTAINEALNA